MDSRSPLIAVAASLDKLGLKVLSDENKYCTWVKSVDMALNDIWVELKDVLRLVKFRPEPMTPEEFGGKLDECRLRPPDCPHHEWTYGFIGRYMYRVLYNMTSGEMQSIVEQCEKRKDGVEADRLLSIHCDPTNFNTSNTLMESIMELGRCKVTSIDDLLATMLEVRKRLGAYEDHVAVLLSPPELHPLYAHHLARRRGMACRAPEAGLR